MALLLAQVVRWGVRRPYRLHNFFAQLDFVGVGSIFIVGLTGLFTGMVFALQSVPVAGGSRREVAGAVR